MTDKKAAQVSVEVGARKRKYWLGCNWKCNGSIEFIKDYVKNMTNDLKYNQNHLGKSEHCITQFCRPHGTSRFVTPCSCASYSKRRHLDWRAKRERSQ
jgi:hypothetical protein